jgi:hypothetical protein
MLFEGREEIGRRHALHVAHPLESRRRDMIEIRACTPDDAAAVNTLLRELGYTVPIRQATENIQ